MIKFRKHTRRSVPMLNTASLPDLIFTVLFFFMIVTHMRNESVKVEYEKPQGTELTRLANKSSITNIHIGILLMWIFLPYLHKRKYLFFRF